VVLRNVLGTMLSHASCVFGSQNADAFSGANTGSGLNVLIS
jgi:hypothetical protein